MAEFEWAIHGTPDEQTPNSPSVLGEIKMELYGKGYTYDDLCSAVQQQERIDEHFLRNCREIFAGRQKAWRLWLVTVYAEKIAFDYCRRDGTAACHFEVVRPTILGLRFMTHPCADGLGVERETTCLMYGSSMSNSQTVKITEIQNGEMTASIEVCAVGEIIR